MDRKPRVGIFVGRNGIAAGVEVTIDYNMLKISQDDIKECFCGSEKCRSILGGRISTTTSDASLTSNNRDRSKAESSIMHPQMPPMSDNDSNSEALSSALDICDDARSAADSFVSAADDYRAMEGTHTKQGTFRCEFGGSTKSFKRNSALTSHKHTHTRTRTKEKPYQCSFRGCTKSFRRQSYLTRHKSTHKLGTQSHPTDDAGHAEQCILGQYLGYSTGHVKEDDEDLIPASAKRKLPHVNYYEVNDDTPPDEPTIKRPKLSQKIRGEIIGVWRNSDQPKDEDKHVIFGFVDDNEMLRLKICGLDRRGDILTLNPKHCWVACSDIIFDAHLASLNTAEIKEYVKIRPDYQPNSGEADEQAVMLAKTAAQNADIQELHPAIGRKSTGGRQSIGRPPIYQTASLKAANAGHSPPSTPKSSPSADSKPIAVLLGYWADSSEHRLEDKHAVYGIVGGTDYFRVKVHQITRDGRYVGGNFPVGAGSLWLKYEKVVFEPELRGMSRPEIEEYVRIRQRDLKHKETESQRKSNEARAISEAKEIVNSKDFANGATTEPKRPSTEIATRYSSKTSAASHEVQVEAVAAISQKLRKENAEANEKMQKEVALAEAVVQETTQQELRKKPSKAWVAPQAATTPGGTLPNNEIKYYNRIRYARKQNGPFQGKLVSQAQVLCIDGEDYIEYRVLARSSL